MVNFFFIQNKIEQFLGLSSSALIQIVLDPSPRNKKASIKNNSGNTVKLPVYTGNDDIGGIVQIKLNNQKKLQHIGIKIQLIGHLQIYSDKSQCTDFRSMGYQLQPAGTLFQNMIYNFNFPKFDKPYESFNGIAASVRYFLRVSIIRNYNSKITKQIDFVVQLPTPEIQKQIHNPVKLEVGIQQCLHIQFEYNKNFYHLKDCIFGKVSFHLVRIKIKCMQIAIVRKQIFGTGSNTINQNQTLVKFQAMDGCPSKGEVVPIRLYLSGVDLTPSYKNIHNRLSVKHYINLVLIDQQQRKYFKQHQVTMYRKK